MVQKLNKTSATHKLQAQLAEGKPVKGGSGSHGKKTAPAKPVRAKPAPVKPAPRAAISKPKVQSKPKVLPAKVAAKKHKK
jgi:hypothetical protein